MKEMNKAFKKGAKLGKNVWIDKKCQKACKNLKCG